MVRGKVKVEGLRELSRALTDELPKATRRGVLRRALKQAAKPIEGDAESRAPVRRGHLQTSVETGTKLSRRQKSKHKKESEVEVFVGAGPLAQATAQEFGTAYHGPQPFMRPAWDSNKRGALQSLKGAITTELEKARKRAARKAARILAKTRRKTT